MSGTAGCTGEASPIGLPPRGRSEPGAALAAGSRAVPPCGSVRVVAEAQAKRFEYVASLERDGSMRAEDGAPLVADDSWTPEHFVLVGLARCTLKSLRHYARDANVSASAQVAGVVTRRESDGLYALVEVEALFEVEIDPVPDDLGQLLARAERGCFVGNSLTAKPRYVWRVNGELAEAAT